MNELQHRKLQELLRASVGPVNRELKTDLWPAMLQRLGERPAIMPWYDWVLLALLAVWFFLSPGVIPVFLYHL